MFTLFNFCNFFFLVNGRMNEIMDWWVDDTGCTDRWRAWWCNVGYAWELNLWMAECMDELKHGWLDGWMDGWMIEWRDGRIEWRNARMDGWNNGWMVDCLVGWVDEWRDERMDGWMDGWNNKWMEEWMDASFANLINASLQNNAMVWLQKWTHLMPRDLVHSSIIFCFVLFTAPEICSAF